MNRPAMKNRGGAAVMRRGQQGVSLLMVLILLIVMSILGVAVLRSSAMQERMSANLRDRNDALQAAEAGLRVAQQAVIANTGSGVTFNDMWNGSKTFTQLRTAAGVTCAADGYCDRSLTGDTEKSLVPTQPTSWAYVSGSSGPQYGYIIEFLGTGKGESKDVQQVCNSTAAPAYLCRRPMFRVTSFGRGRGMGRVVLQANIISQPQ